MRAEHDALGLLQIRRHALVHFGQADASAALAELSSSSRVNQMPVAEITVDLDLLTEPVDYFAGLRLAFSDYGNVRPVFGGNVVAARPDGRRSRVSARSAESVTETLIGGLSAKAIPPFELIYTMARIGGFPEELINVEGIDGLPLETFEVTAPVRGIRVSAALDFGGVRFKPGPLTRPAGTAESPELWAGFEVAAYAVVIVTASLCLKAEEAGLAAIDLALAWLTVCLRYGLALLPNGRPLPFDRNESLSLPDRGDVVFVRGLATTRQWVRSPERPTADRSAELTRGNPRIDPDLPDLSLQEELALLALARSCRESDPLARIHALFETIEFYAATARAPALFTSKELKSIRKSLPSNLKPEQTKRLQQMASDLNSPPLRARLMAAIDEDQVPLVADGDIELLWRLRQIRNDVVHGRRKELPVAEDIEHATSIVARLLVHRIARRKQEIV